MIAGLPLMKNVLTPLAKKVLLTFGLSAFGLSAAISATDAAIKKKPWIRNSGIIAFIIKRK